jgi:hypothetical protein
MQKERLKVTVRRPSARGLSACCEYFTAMIFGSRRVLYNYLSEQFILRITLRRGSQILKEEHPGRNHWD